MALTLLAACDFVEAFTDARNGGSRRFASTVGKGKKPKALVAFPSRFHYCARTMQDPWDIPAAISLYNTDRWGLGYFSINPKGNIEVRPTQDATTPIDIMEVIEEARREYGLGFPMVLRFQDLL